jgi:hypothetical protein
LIEITQLDSNEDIWDLGRRILHKELSTLQGAFIEIKQKRGKFRESWKVIILDL